MIDDYWLWRAATGPSDIAGVAAVALQGDETAAGAVWDYSCEHWEADVVPFEAGQCYLICTQTLYYLGRVEAIKGAFLELADSSWVHWTGRLSTLLAKQSTAQAGWPSGHQRPRTEYVGPSIVSLSSIISAYPWSGPLPTESLS
jgi:hypothetical protein